MSKAAKVRAKKAAAEAERERAIAEAKLTARDYAAEETAAIAAKLKPRGLKIVEVPSDGNCMYRSLLRQWSSRVNVSTYADVRSIIAREMQDHSSLCLTPPSPHQLHNTLPVRFSFDQVLLLCRAGGRRGLRRVLRAHLPLNSKTLYYS
jgi:hypothetical protein